MRICVPIFLLLLVYQLQGQSTYLDNHSYSFSTDQDAFAKAYNQDRNYTMGFGLSASIGEKTDKWWLIAPAIRNGIDHLLGINTMRSLKTNTNVSRYSLLGNGFTPFDIGVPGFQEGDRPYASLLVLGSDRVSVFNDDLEEPQEDEDDEAFYEFLTAKPFAISTGLYVGFLGLGVGGEVQSLIHRKQWFGTTRPVPLGWDTQISDGGELTAMYQISFIAPLVTVANPINPDFKWMETTLDVGTQVGYYTNLNAGINIKLGNFDAPFYTNQGLLNAIAQAPDTQRPPLNWYFFSSMRSRLVYYNALMQGQFKENVYELSKSDIEPLVFEAEMGVAVTFFDKAEIVFKPLVYRSQEFAAAGRNHIWANIGATLILN